MFNVISLGAGVQSSTMALMAANGELEAMPDCAIFADTQAEPKEVYDWLDWLEKQLPYPVYRVGKGDLEKDNHLIRNRKSDGSEYVKINIPLFTMSEDGRGGIFGRQCTADYKIGPIIKKIKELASIKRAEKKIKVYQMIGISTDEAHRQKPARHKWLKSIYPLIDANMSRGHCIEWMKLKGYPAPPRSACYFCLFHSDKEWDKLSNEYIVKAIKFEDRLHLDFEKGLTSFKRKPFLHSSCKPLGTVKFDVNKSLSLFGNECEGMCGV
tara:strand:- start:848 stop:1651 length:804 start_codon:yes stop_codon:yes gene_type:complete